MAQPSFLDALIQQNPGVDAKGILALAQADPRTVNSINGGMLRVWLNANALAPRLNRSADAIQAAGNVANADLLRSFVNQGLAGADFDANQAAYAAAADGLRQAMLAMYDKDKGLGVTQGEIDQLIAIGGGYQVFDATLEDCQAGIDRAAAAQASAAREAAIMSLNVANEQRFATAQAEFNAGPLALYNAGQRNCDVLRGDPALPLPADLAGLDAMGGGG